MEGAASLPTWTGSPPCVRACVNSPGFTLFDAPGSRALRRGYVGQWRSGQKTEELNHATILRHGRRWIHGSHMCDR